VGPAKLYGVVGIQSIENSSKSADFILGYNPLPPECEPDEYMVAPFNFKCTDKQTTKIVDLELYPRTSSSLITFTLLGVMPSGAEDVYWQVVNASGDYDLMLFGQQPNPEGAAVPLVGRNAQHLRSKGPGSEEIQGIHVSYSGYGTDLEWFRFDGTMPRTMYVVGVVDDEKPVKLTMQMTYGSMAGCSRVSSCLPCSSYRCTDDDSDEDEQLEPVCDGGDMTACRHKRPVFKDQIPSEMKCVALIVVDAETGAAMTERHVFLSVGTEKAIREVFGTEPGAVKVHHIDSRKPRKGDPAYGIDGVIIVQLYFKMTTHKPLGSLLDILQHGSTPTAIQIAMEQHLPAFGFKGKFVVVNADVQRSAWMPPSTTTTTTTASSTTTTTTTTTTTEEGTHLKVKYITLHVDSAVFEYPDPERRKVEHTIEEIVFGMTQLNDTTVTLVHPEDIKQEEGRARRLSQHHVVAVAVLKHQCIESQCPAAEDALDRVTERGVMQALVTSGVSWVEKSHFLSTTASLPVNNPRQPRIPKGHGGANMITSASYKWILLLMLLCGICGGGVAFCITDPVHGPPRCCEIDEETVPIVQMRHSAPSSPRTSVSHGGVIGESPGDGVKESGNESVMTDVPPTHP